MNTKTNTSTIAKTKIGTVHDLSFSPDGKLLAKVQTFVHVWDMATGKELMKTRPLSHCSRIAWSPDSKQLAVTNTCNHSVVLNPINGKEIRNLKNNAPLGSDGADPSFSGCGKFLVTGRWDGTLLVYDIKSARLTFSENYPGEMIAGVYPINAGKKWLVLHSPKTPEGKNVAPPDYFTLHAWPFQPGKGKRIDLPSDRSVGGCAISNDGKFAALRLYQVSDGPVEKHQFWPAASFTKPGNDTNRQPANWTFSTGPDDFQILSLPDAKVIHKQTLAINYSGTPVRWSDDGKWLTAILKNDSVAFWKTGDFKRMITYAIEKPQGVAISPRGDCVAFGSWGKASRVVPWNEVFGDA